MKNKLPLFYFPPSICWVDDNQVFLDAAHQFFKDDYNCLTFVDPKKAMEYLTIYQSPYSDINFTREFTENDIFNTHNHLPIDINLSEIIRLADIEAIKNELAILIIDNYMPNINGIDLCYKLKKSSYKKILLTGQTNPLEVINAFNEGIIDKYLEKDKNVTEKLQNNIRELTHLYFYEKTKNLLSHIETSRPSPLSDEVFIDFFYRWCESNNYKEFYLINKHGSFLVNDNNGLSTYFIVMSEHDKNEFVKLNDDALDHVGHLLDQVTKGKLIPFFGVGKECWEFDHSDWKNYFYPSNVLQGREKYYWSTINKTEI